ncbi:Thermostable beta-glucosidase B [Nonomuraea coxensis DSM 45129]|uniref:Thermostable beta-glucosidase B n=1 Tax=Nonomuraea coxensis DSM 45129 TaxID=1122611 RepID=A0ABX8U091_9ACTN|nr:glycoside hydrolase family 3 C-terminal domain-containing protein [Nonomuraea coxensis]QYC41166.1 Thermostable beta-glucosidase B [Nonomuraea coxensis DSM 45129]
MPGTPATPVPHASIPEEPDPDGAGAFVTRREVARLLAGLGAVVACAGPAWAEPVPARAGVRRSRVDALLRELTLQEKIALLHGAADPASRGQAGYVPGVPRLGIPELRLTDGPAGIRHARTNTQTATQTATQTTARAEAQTAGQAAAQAEGPAAAQHEGRAEGRATALPAPVALAATFAPDLARRYGATLGREGRALGMDVILAPMVNVVRAPQAGRNFETLGEDPLLAAALAAAEVRGIQGEGAIATVKHYAANNFENERQTVDVRVDERTLREIYLPAFEAAVAAGAGAVMAAYPRVNGRYCAENRHLLTEVLREDWRFSGWVMSDWGGTRSGVPSIEAGLDMEMPSGARFAGLAGAVASGRLAESVVDRSVRRILLQLDRFGLLGEPRNELTSELTDGQPGALTDGHRGGLTGGHRGGLAGGGRARPVLDGAAGAAAAREVALAGAVLLRNERGLLPLARADLADLAVIGPTAATPLAGGGGSARVLRAGTESPFAALRRRAGGDARVLFATGVDLDGVPVPASALSLTRTGRGGGQETVTRVDHTGAAALPAGSSWTWTGTITAPVTGDYDLRVQGAGAPPSAGGAITLTVDGTRIGAVEALLGGNSSLIATADGLTNAGAVVRLEGGRPTPLRISATGVAGTPLEVRLAWVTPARRQEARDAAADLARGARAAVVFAFDEGTEGADRTSLALPKEQDALIAAVAAANPRTAVVLNTGHPVLMPWLADVPAVLQMWYPGQEGADATAALLLGAACPGGKLPVTFPARAEDGPATAPERRPGGTAVYGEGVFVGYRHYDARRIEPLFPFGHGLSYTRFAYAGLSVRPSGDGLRVAFTVANVGRREGVEVAQVYVTPPADPPVPMPPRVLAAFARVRLAPGERRRVTVTVPGRVLRHWDGAGWALAAGRRAVQVGSSSRDLRLRREVTVR